METDTRISNLAFDLNNTICTKEFKNLEFTLEVLERAIKGYRERSLK